MNISTASWFVRPAFNNNRAAANSGLVMLPGSASCSVSGGLSVQPPARIPAEARSISADVQSQTRHPKLDIAKQLGREIFRPQLALAQKLPFLLRHVRQTVTPHHKPQFHRLVCSHFPIFPIPKRQVLPANDTPIQALEASLLSGAS
jgi:hypothetical protein